MLDLAITGSFLLGCITTFTVVNLYNISVTHKTIKENHQTRQQPETRTPTQPSGTDVSLAAFATLVYGAEVLIYIFLSLTEMIPQEITAIMIAIPLVNYLQTTGIILTGLGYFLFVWSIIIRGRYATSWIMASGHKLVTAGPYRYIRHPSYLSYMLLFVGLPLTVPNPIMLVPLVGIYGYYKVTFREETLLTERFGEEFTKYQERTGRFMPGLTRRKSSQNAS
jgi:protein-S-isoprenylcysteine O-methyltransferase Ste14